MNKKSLKPGVAMKCKPGTVIGHFSLNQPGLPYIVVTHKSSLFAAPDFLNGDNEVLIYIGTREDKSVTEPMSVLDGFTNTKSKVLTAHEILWRGAVFRMREGTLKYLSLLHRNK